MARPPEPKRRTGVMPDWLIVALLTGGSFLFLFLMSLLEPFIKD
jgi:hypothetical protein